jgi:hypothetical protein
LGLAVATAAITRDREAGGLGPVLVVGDEALFCELVLTVVVDSVFRKLRV